MFYFWVCNYDSYSKAFFTSLQVIDTVFWIFYQWVSNYEIKSIYGSGSDVRFGGISKEELCGGLETECFRKDFNICSLSYVFIFDQDEDYYKWLSIDELLIIMNEKRSKFEL